MRLRYLALASLAACGKVSSADAPDAAAMTIAYQGTLGQTTPKPFGGAPFCNYTITLKQLEIDLAILPPGQATSGRIQALNVEATDAACTHDIIPATIANYTLSSSSVGAGTTTLTFAGAAGNAPMASLVVSLTPSGSAYNAVLTFHRTDIAPPLDWMVQTTLLLSPQ